STSCAATSSTTVPACGYRRSTTAASTPRRCGSVCFTMPGAGACRRRTSNPCCRRSRPPSPGSRPRRVTASSPTTAATPRGWRIRAGRTRRTRSVSGTGASPSHRSRSPRSRATPTRPPSGVRRCWTRSAGTAVTAGGDGPSRYHCGTVWPHDTALAILGLARSGHVLHSLELIEGILAAGLALPGPLPELWGGDSRWEVPEPVPYPAACRPQAWAAASVVVLLTALLGLRPDVPGGILAIHPVHPAPVGAVRAEGLRVAGRPLTVATD